MRSPAPGRALAILGATAIGIALAGCDTVPQPFRHDGPPPELARPPEEVRPIAVLPFDGSPRAKALADAVAKAFQDRDIPASVNYGETGDPVLESRLDRRPGHSDIEWRLRGPDRRPRASYRQDLPETWAAPSPKDIAALANQAVAVLSGITTASPSGQIPAAPHRTTVKLVPPTGLPGDGNAALGRAMRNALERSGLLVVGDHGDYIVEGKFSVVPGRPGEDVLNVSWTVRTPDGHSLGTIDQHGPVAKGSLDQSWGGLAGDIAAGGVTGVLEVLGGRAGASTLQNN